MNRITRYSKGPFVLSAILLAVTAAAQTTYTVRDLGTLPKTDASMGIDVNDNGEVVGHTSSRGIYQHSFYWSAASGMVDMGFFAVNMRHINNLGQVFGPGWVWKRGENGNQPLYLSGFRPGVAVTTSDLNDAGEIAGISDTNTIIGYDSGGNPQYAGTATIWKKVGGLWTPAALPMPLNDNRGGIHQLTNIAPDGTGQAVGFTAEANWASGSLEYFAKHFVRWSRVYDTWTVAAIVDLPLTASVSNAFLKMDDVGDAGGSGWFVDSANNIVTIGMGATGMDVAGNLSGDATLPDGQRAVRRDKSTGVIASLGTLGGSRSSASDDFGNNTYRTMSAAGQIVGWSEPAAGAVGSLHAFLWTASTGMLDLNSSAITPNKSGFQWLHAAAAINSTGSITGHGHVTKGNTRHAFLLTPQ